MDIDWPTQAKNILKSEMRRRDISYKALSLRFNAAGVQATPRVLMNKMSRGGFSAAYFLQALHLIGAKDLRLE